MNQKKAGFTHSCVLFYFASHLSRKVETIQESFKWLEKQKTNLKTDFNNKLTASLALKKENHVNQSVNYVAW